MFAGIDSQKDTLAVAVVDQVGLAVAVVQEPNTRAGFVRIGELLAKHEVIRVGIEGSAITGVASPHSWRWTGTSPVSGCSRCRR